MLHRPCGRRIAHVLRTARSLVGSVALAILLSSGLGPSLANAQEAAPRSDSIRVAGYDVHDLTYPELRAFEVPEPERIELENGMIVFLLEDHELPMVSAAARIAAGSVWEPGEQRGLASITGTVMRTGGTRSMPSDSLNAALEGLGANVETGMGATSGSAFMTTLSDHVDRVLSMYADVLREPAFEEAKVAQAKNQQKSVISRRNDDPQQIAFREFDEIVYGPESPYARTPEYYTIDRIERQDLVDFHRSYVRPENVILSVWGDFDADEMEQKLREEFGDWSPPGTGAEPEIPEPEATRAHSVSYIPKQDVNQSTVLMGHPGEITRRSEDYPAVIVMNQVLSGGFSSRLFQNVRRDQGLAYAVFGTYSANYTRPGRFYAGIFTQSSTTVEGLRAVQTEVERMREEAPTPEEVELARESYLNSFVFNFDTEREVLNRLMTYEYHGYPSDFLRRTRDGIEQVGPEDVHRVAEEYLYPSESHILVLGRGEDFSRPLAELSRAGSVDTVDISIPTSPPEEAGTSEEVNAESASAGREALRAAREALGGAAFRDLANLRVEQESVVQTQQGEQTISVVQLISLPAQFRIEQTLPNGVTVVMADDGETLRMRTPQGVQQAPAQVRTQVQSAIWRSLPFLMANLDHQDLSVEGRGTETVDGTEYRTVRVNPPGGEPFTLYLDSETYRPRRMDYTQVTQQGPVSRTDVYESYVTENGISLPEETVTHQDETQQGRSTLTSVTVNDDVSDDQFSLGQ